MPLTQHSTYFTDILCIASQPVLVYGLLSQQGKDKNGRAKQNRKVSLHFVTDIPISSFINGL